MSAYVSEKGHFQITIIFFGPDEIFHSPDEKINHRRERERTRRNVADSGHFFLTTTPNGGKL